jgi:prephenate dehydratase
MDGQSTIVGEQKIRIKHVLMAKRGTKVEDVRKVYSHPQALSQCRDYLDKLRVERVPMGDTATSAKEVAASPDPTLAAIASKRAAEIYGLEPIDFNIASQNKNYTRFFIISNEQVAVQGADKSSASFELRHMVGSLCDALICFKEQNVNLITIVPRPKLIADEPFTYRFWVDFEGSKEDRNVSIALNMLRQNSAELKVLGSYKRAKNPA